MQQTNLRKLISGFLRLMHAEAGNSIKHVTVVVHGAPEHLEEGRYTEHITVRKPQGFSQLSYQDMEVDAPIDNNVTLVVTNRLVKQA